MKRSSLTKTISSSDTDYLYNLAGDTWRCIDYYVAPETGFPYDSDIKPKHTNTTNVGLYLTSIAAACEFGFLDEEGAVARIEKILDSLERLENWNGFLNNWVDVRGKTQANPGTYYISDFNKLPAGLIVVRQKFPQVYEQSTRILESIKWDIFYDKNTNSCYGAFDVVNKRLSGRLGYLASDTRLASFFMIASNAAPAETWEGLDREIIEQYEMSFYKPGWNWGGIFMQAMGGIFLDERKTEIGKSVADFAYVQMLYAKENNLPVWGWSSSYIPGSGYTEGGFLPTNVITPHASALAIIYYPQKVVENLKRLDAMGARKSFNVKGKANDFGFRDAINVKTGKTTSNPTYLTSLDQTMLFLSLTNYLYDGTIWKLFEKDPIVKNGKELLRDFYVVENNYLEVYAMRDEQPLKLVKERENRQSEPVLMVDDFDDGRDPNNLNGRCELWKLDAHGYQGFAPQFDSENKVGDFGYGLKLSYDLTPNKRAFCAYSQYIQKADLTPYSSLSFYIKGEKAKGFSRKLKVEIWDINNVEIIYFINGITDEWQKMVIPFDEFKGILSRWDKVVRVTIVLENYPDFYKNTCITKSQGVFYVDNIAFEK